MITDWNWRHDVLLPINQNYDKIRETNKASIERWTLLKRRYECWKTQQFTQQSAPQQRAQNDAYCPITSMTCATVQLMLLLYIELSNSFLIGRKRTVNFRNQRP